MKHKEIIVSILVVMIVFSGAVYLFRSGKSQSLPQAATQADTSEVRAEYLSAQDLSGSYNEIFDRLQSEEYEVGLYFGLEEDMVHPAGIYFKKEDDYINLQETILKSYIDKDSHYAESPEKIGNDIYFTSKTGLYKLDVQKRTMYLIYKDAKLMPSSFVEFVGGSILTGWSTNTDPAWGAASSGSIVETDIYTNQSKTYAFVIPETAHIKVDRTFDGIEVSHNSKFIWVSPSFDVPEMPLTDANFKERIRLIHTGKMPVINRSTGEVKYISFSEVNGMPIEDLPNWQGWPGYISTDSY